MTSSTSAEPGRHTRVTFEDLRSANSRFRTRLRSTPANVSRRQVKLDLTRKTEEVCQCISSLDGIHPNNPEHETSQVSAAMVSLIVMLDVYAGMLGISLSEGVEEVCRQLRDESRKIEPEPSKLSPCKMDLEPCPVCGLPLKQCPSGLVCDNGHGFSEP